MKVNEDKYSKAIKYLHGRQKESHELMLETVNKIKIQANKMDIENPQTIIDFADLILEEIMNLINGAVLLVNIDSLERLVESVLEREEG